MIEGKGLGGKKVNRVNVSLTNKYSLKLNRLATACNLKPTTLAGLLIEKHLDNPQVVVELQKEYCLQSAYRVLLINKGGELQYVLNENEREDFK
jgi:sulfur carrier protein ThiS